MIQRIAVFIIAFCTLFTNSVFAKEPMNVSLAIRDAVVYHANGEYEKDIQSQINVALTYLKKRLDDNKKNPSQQKLALVLDIDDTALSSYDQLQCLHPPVNKTPTELANDRIIKPTLALFQFARDNGVAVFFITGRFEKWRDITIKELEDAGYKGFTDVYMKPNDYSDESVIPFKSGQRKKIVEAGFDIVLNVGDQDSDLAGNYADKAIKLPNPFYYIP